MNSVCNNVLLEHYRASSREDPIEDDESTNIPDPSLDVDRFCRTRKCNRTFVKFWTNCPSGTDACCGKSSWKNVTKTRSVMTLAWTGIISESCFIAPSSFKVAI